MYCILKLNLSLSYNLLIVLSIRKNIIIISKVSLYPKKSRVIMFNCLSGLALVCAMCQLVHRHFLEEYI